MGHLSEGQLQAYLDGEVEGAAARGLATHLEACATCTRMFAGMRTTAARATRALAWIDRPASTAAAFAEVVGARDASVRRIDAHRSWGRPARVGFLKAAMFVLFAGSAAAAVIPGSPVQRWLGDAWQRLSGTAPEPAREAAPVPPADSEIAPLPEVTAPAEVASISIEPAEATLHVTLAGGHQTAAVRVVFVNGANATVETDASASARFSTGPSTIEARGLGAGTVTVSLPRSLAYAIIMVDGQTLLEKDGSSVRTPGPVVERSDDTIVFRMN